LCTKHQEDTVVNSDFIAVHTLSVQNPKIQCSLPSSQKPCIEHISEVILVWCVTSVSSSYRFVHRFSYTLCDSAVDATSITPWFDHPHKIWWTVQIFKSISLWFIHSNITYALLDWILSHDVSAFSLNCNIHRFLPHLFVAVFVTLWFWCACCMFQPSATPWFGE
jgi:hypothetical protein